MRLTTRAPVRRGSQRHPSQGPDPGRNGSFTRSELAAVSENVAQLTRALPGAATLCSKLSDHPKLLPRPRSSIFLPRFPLSPIMTPSPGVGQRSLW